MLAQHLMWLFVENTCFSNAVSHSRGYTALALLLLTLMQLWLALLHSSFLLYGLLPFLLTTLFSKAVNLGHTLTLSYLSLSVM